VLKKDGLVMDTATSREPMPNTYKEGRFYSGAAEFEKHKNWLMYVPGISSIPGIGSIPDVDMRKFKAGEKCWVTNIHVQDDGVVFTLLSDPVFNLRYYAELRFPIAKGTRPDTDKMLSAIGEVFTVQPSDLSASGNTKAAAGNDPPPRPPTLYGPGEQPAPPATAASKPMAPIPPPPPPPETAPATPNLDVGWTREQVIAAFGSPMKIASLDGGKEIDYYADFKLTLVDGKVTKVQGVP
jgi:hypothetical protein